jgi:hypothetical protein
MTNKFSFDAWVTEQATKIEAAVREVGLAGRFGVAAWVVPSSKALPGEPGYIHVGFDAPFFGADIVRLGPHGTSLARCPVNDIRHHLYNAARSYPVLPIAA